MQTINELQLAKELIRYPSVTPIDAGVMKFLEKKLKKLGFKTKILEFKEKNSKSVIFLTSKDDEIDELLGLKLGADDFVKKSGGFSIKVLIERIRVQLRKNDTNNTLEENKSLIAHGRLKLDPSQLDQRQSGLYYFYT